ncbi:MFS transporter [Microdochium trichocladiopsis]|uniref:MFS transporter n=1 Tax=Microdochium trichocladiopsis TaxID=1682393 RepID=A0A9P9BX86_9PEZI|nr:MFS transporter [Microdochium trichocladiopsis]KAH7035836.1 MFS transporter [Microdochium trichocladiopsis]
MDYSKSKSVRGPPNELLAIATLDQDRCRIGLLPILSGSQAAASTGIAHLGFMMAKNKSVNDIDREPSVQDGAADVIIPAEKTKYEQEHVDIGLAYFQQSQTMDPAHREAVARRVLKKIDFVLLPAMCLIYLLSFLDKQTLNYANVYGLKTDLGLVGNQYSWVASITNIGYLVRSYPSTLALQKFPIGKFISVMLVLWGIILVATVGAHNWAGLMALRFILGGLEAGIGPAWMLITSMFWTREEQPLRMCIWLGSNGISQMLGSGISWGLGHTNNQHLTPWQLVFLVIGVITICAGVVAFIYFPSSPVDCRLCDEEERVVSIWRVADNQTGIKHGKILSYQIREALLEPRVWFIAGQQLSIGIINSSVANFMSALLSGFCYSPVEVVLWQLPNGAFQLVCTVAAGLVASRFKNMSIIMILVVHVPSLAGIIGIATIDLGHRLALTACCWLLGVVGAAIILNWSVIASNVAGHTKRMTVNGLNFVCYATGNIIGPFMFTPAEAPRYLTAIKALIGIYASSMFFTALIGVCLWLSNRNRDREAAANRPAAAETSEEALEDGFLDKTDRELRSFRYKL